MRYLVAKYKVADHWYPSKLEDRARADECLEWTDANLRSGATGYFYNKVWNRGGLWGLKTPSGNISKKPKE